METTKPLRIDIWSDIVCPWCWIGKHRLRKALEMPGAPEVEIHWHPYLLDPEADATPVPLREAYARKFGGAERTERILADTQAAARADGLPMDFERGQGRVSTLDAHRVLGLASAHGVAEAVSEALFRAHFEHGRNLADRTVLVEAAAAGGLPADRVDALLDSDEGKAEVQASLRQAQAIGVRGVPFFVMDGRLAVSGAQAPELFAQAFAQLGRMAATEGSADEAAAACTPDGCTP